MNSIAIKVTTKVKNPNRYGQMLVVRETPSGFNRVAPDEIRGLVNLLKRATDKSSSRHLAFWHATFMLIWMVRYTRHARPKLKIN